MKIENCLPEFNPKKSIKSQRANLERSYRAHLDVFIRGKSDPEITANGRSYFAECIEAVHAEFAKKWPALNATKKASAV